MLCEGGDGFLVITIGCLTSPVNLCAARHVIIIHRSNSSNSRNFSVNTRVAFFFSICFARSHANIPRPRSKIFFRGKANVTRRELSFPMNLLPADTGLVFFSSQVFISTATRVCATFSREFLVNFFRIESNVRFRGKFSVHSARVLVKSDSSQLLPGSGVFEAL